ncbi:MAG: c-type cytochrome [Mariniblastus sp.]|nr:c-type cytochrome [Mariniblastus sp.]
MFRSYLLTCLFLFPCFPLGAVAQENTVNGNRLVYLAEPGNPFYVDGNFPRLITPQWIGDPEVEGVVVLSIDDMREPEGYEAFLRPILDRLKQIDGRAPVSILTNTIHTDHPQLQTWLQEGLSLEVHTVDHPCPCLQNGNFDAARSTYERCVDLMHAIPENRPVAYRMPCCDSINSTSPRFWLEIFNRQTGEGNFLQMDSSVFHLFTSDDPELPAAVTTRADGESRFGHYLPFPSYVNTIENYPYPYLIGDLCWQIPCLVPSDWEGQHVNQANSPRTLADMKVAVDATVIKQGATSLVFHPHAWITHGQLVDLIDHAVEKHGERIRFLNFREQLECLNQNLLAGQSVRSADGQDNGVRLIDLNNDGYLDVVIGNPQMQRTRLWIPETKSWRESTFPVPLVQIDPQGVHQPTGVQFFVIRPDGQASLMLRNEDQAGVWHFVDGQWAEDRSMFNGLEVNGQPIFTGKNGVDQGVRFRDLNGDGRCELISGASPQPIFQWNPTVQRWDVLPFHLPAETRVATPQGDDSGLRFVDIDRDGFDDILFSNEQQYSLHLFESMQEGWSRLAQQGTRPDQNGIPPIVNNGANQGAWFSRDHLWIQNEATSGLPDLVDRRSFTELLGDEALRPKSPEASLRAIEVDPKFRVELVAAEPLVQDPVAFDWGPDGRLWVVEMADYPLGLDDRGKPGGRVRVLEDTDGDGKYDQSTLFADNLPFPTDVMVWRDGVLVTAAPDVLFLADHDGDGRSDHREAWFSGFNEGNQQHRVNGLRWGLDNRVYLANGDSGGRIQSVKTGETIDINGRDLRIEPDGGAMQALTGQTQHGRCRDDWGNWWGANNSIPMIQFVLDDHYLARNPFVPPPDPRFFFRQGDWGLFPISRVVSHYSGYQSPPAGQASQFTSACGTIVYRDSLLGDELAGNLFVSEPVHNLVHRRVVEQNGLLRRPVKPADEAGREFLRSRDSWFRPTSLRTGPEGALWIADMYRLVIEHPEWIDDTVEETLDLRNGHTMGRIYRVLPAEGPVRSPVDLTDKTPQQLVRMLNHPSGTLRDLVHRQLLWREDRITNRLLRQTFLESPHPKQRLTSLCILSGRDALTIDLLIDALQDDHPGLRRHAIRISERWTDPEQAPWPLAGSDDASTDAPDPKQVQATLFDSLFQLAQREQDREVLRQLAYTLGEFEQPAAARLLGQMLARHRDDPYLSAAALSSIQGQLPGVLAGVWQEVGDAAPADLPIEPLVQTALGQHDMASVQTIFRQVMPTDEQPLDRQRLQWLAAIDQRVQDAGYAMVDILPSEQTDQTLQKVRGKARQLLVDSEQERAVRTAALRFLVTDPSFMDRDTDAILALLTPQTPADLQQTVIEAIGRTKSNATLNQVLAGWDQYGPLTRDRIIGQFLQRPVTTRLLLGAVDRQLVPPRDINLAYSQALIHDPDPEIASRSARLLDPGINQQRQNVIDHYLPIVKQGGDPERGQVHFKTTCSACHQLGELGYPVGPNLAALNDLSADFLTTHILDSPRAIEDKYRNYIALTQDGRQYSGLLQAETATSLTLIGQQGETHTILKRDLEEGGFRRSQVSMMPQGLETSLDPAAMADLVSYIVQFREPPKTFPGNQPRLIRATEEGRLLRLTGSTASVFGPSLVFEAQYGNLGFWGSVDDRAQWRVVLPAAGQYDVYLDWAVADGTAGNPYQLQIGSESLRGEVESTGSWDQYRQSKVGSLNLPAGPQVVVFRAAAPLEGYLMDLREICLIPAGQQPPAEFQVGEE